MTLYFANIGILSDNGEVFVFMYGFTLITIDNGSFNIDLLIRPKDIRMTIINCGALYCSLYCLLHFGSLLLNAALNRSFMLTKLCLVICHLIMCA